MSKVGVDTFALADSGLDYKYLDIVSNITDSIKSNLRDWCYDKSKHREIINSCLIEGCSGCYRTINKKNGEFLCIEYIPCKYYRPDGSEIKGRWYDINKIPLEYKTTILLGSPKVLKPYGAKPYSLDGILARAIGAYIKKIKGTEFFMKATEKQLQEVIRNNTKCGYLHF